MAHYEGRLGCSFMGLLDHRTMLGARIDTRKVGTGEGSRKKAGGRRQKAEGRRQKAGGRRQKAEGRRQKAGGSQILIQKACVIESDLSERCVMDRTKKLLLNIGSIAIVSIIGAIMMMGVDTDGTRWLKFLLYFGFFASISSPAVFSSSFSCSSVLRRISKRS
jgi:hypothetical protein